MSNVKTGSQYIKDLSFEVPNAPEVFLTPATKPDIELSIDIDAKRLSVNAFEVILKIKAEAKANEQIIFICELYYGGVFILDEKIQDKKEIEQILLIYCPNVLFPFARRIIADCVADGGFPPLMLEPINFSELYQKRSNQQDS
ncbi:MAG: protein-export chaperone SecB [Rickettsiaceae bacterium]|jgi:preprotein translocase subunit SecB|nr:protein-export chaperone SecB [Rickettsiaceae bacterium]